MRLEQARFVLGQIAHGMIRPQKEINEAVDTVFDEEVLVTVHFLGVKDVKESWYVDLSRQIGGEWCGYSDEFRVTPKRHKTIAWMPLPEPYEGGDAE